MADQELSVKTPRKSLLAAFCAYDKNKSGKYGAAIIETRDLVNVLRLLGRRPETEEELEDMIKQVDEKRTGFINFIDFYMLMLRIDDNIEKKRVQVEMEKREKERREREKLELEVLEEEQYGDELLEKERFEEEQCKNEKHEKEQRKKARYENEKPAKEELQNEEREKEQGKDMPRLD